MLEPSILQSLSAKDFDVLCSLTTEQNFATDDVVFNEGDEATELYFVKSGGISIFMNKYHRTEDISSIHKGDCFGEMAILSNTRRTASAKASEESTLLCLDKNTFKSMITNHPEIGEKIHALIATRKQELVLKESIMDSIGFSTDNMHLSIKGDPSLRETVFNRERYDSIVDVILPELTPNIESMLIERNVFRVLINFNSGEVEAYTLFTPFTPETHAANRLTSKSYLDRHFPLINYEEKSKIVKNIYALLTKELTKDSSLGELSSHWKHLFLDPLEKWQAVPIEKIKQALSQLATLRSLENYYLRNFSINTTQDVIRMQFNCDGTHIVSSEDYQKFLRDNL
jgi:CRP-like cAMP-binding protein